jgi:hypothetical protein
MTADSSAQARPGIDRPITRADLEAKFEELRGTAAPSAQKARGAGLAAVLIGGVLLLVAAYVIGRRKGRQRRTIVEVRRV